MFRRLRALVGYRIAGTDGEFGRVDDFYFDERDWRVRYLVVDTGSWLPGREVLVAPGEMGRPDADRSVVPVGLTQEQIEKSPPVQSDMPISRQQELELARYYHWATEWDTGPLSRSVGRSVAWETPEGERAKHEDQRRSHLRSVEEIAGYHIQAAGGEIGKVDDVLADPQSWMIRYVVVDTGGWLSDRLVLLAPEWIQKVSWAHQQLVTDLSREKIETCPEHKAQQIVDREEERRLHEHFGRTPYWELEERGTGAKP